LAELAFASTSSRTQHSIVKLALPKVSAPPESAAETEPVAPN